MSYSISPLTPENAQKIIDWRYGPPYDLYNMAPEHLPGLLNSDLRYHQVLDQYGELVGFCCFGEDARVPGGEYDRGEPGVIDIGVGLKPELTGKGLGKDFVEAVLDFAQVTHQPEIYRVTVAEFNQRSLNTFLGLGFCVSSCFTRELADLKFTQLEKNWERNQNE